MEWQNGRQLSRAATERDSTTEDVLDFAYDANGIRTRKTVTRNTYRPVQTYKVTFVADGKTVKTMNVTEGYTLKDSDYPAVPEKAGYTGAWQRYTSPVKSNVTVSATYTKITTYYTVTFVADGETVKTISVYSGYKLKDSDYPRVPYKVGYEGSWQKRTAPVTSNVTINAVYTQILHTVSFRVMDEGIIHTMEVPDRYVLQEEDYPTIPKRVGYTSRWDTRVTMIVRDTIIDAIYSDGSTHEVTFLAYGNENLGTITVEDGYLLQEEDYPTIPERTGYRGSWPTQVDPIYEDTIIHAQYEEAIPVPTLPTAPGEIMSGGEGEPVEADEPEEGENDTTPAETEHTISGVLASTETVTHEYLTQSGKVVRETITTSMDTTTLDFFYDESGRPFAFNYSVDGSDFETYYYILNLQGDVVQIIDEGGVLQAEYVYSPWGEVISAEGDLAEINPLRYRGYYYDSETGFYYLQSRYYDPENHRFINADSFASTGQGIVGTNMFAYVNSDPVNCIDADGKTIEYITSRYEKTLPVDSTTSATVTLEFVVKIPTFDNVTVTIGKGTAIESISLNAEIQGLAFGGPSLSLTAGEDSIAVSCGYWGTSVSVDFLNSEVTATQVLTPPCDNMEVRVSLTLHFDPRVIITGVMAVGTAAMAAEMNRGLTGTGLGMERGNQSPLYASGGGMLGAMYRSASRYFRIM